MYRYLIKPFLFCFSPETAHHITLAILQFISRFAATRYLFTKIFVGNTYPKPVLVAGLHFPNAVGLAAGFDKNARYTDAFALLGFGFIEIGTVTPLAQSGNPKPRLFRLPKDHALINRMGFNNDGAEAAAKNLRARKNKSIIIGGNIGKNKITPNEQAVDDYIKCFNILYEVVDYFVVNVSSPNTPGLRELQEKKPLMEILHTLMNLNRSKPHLKPLFLKIAPDLSETQLNDIVDIVKASGIHGIIATNTTISRSGLITAENKIKDIGAGGLSGTPLTKRSTDVIAYLRNRLPQNTVIIGVGGIHSAKDALDKLHAGASLLQLYTGLIYEGPALVSRVINQSSKP
jgi:dihydroorotate dehydrogenase